MTTIERTCNKQITTTCR